MHVPTGFPEVSPGNPDNWKHRSKDMRCGTCIYFVEKRTTGERNLDAKTLGRCRRRSPTINGWPAVFDEDWCGDHKIDEEKI